MQLVKVLGFVAIALMLSAPAANAKWMFAQSWEPDTPYDDPTFMWEDPAPPGVARVYFAAFAYHAYAGVNPNVGALETRFENPNSETHNALLGVWVDCNGDGYVGMAETAVREYPANLLLDDSACPALTGSPQVWPSGAYNYNHLVTELIPIGREGNLTLDARLYVDPDARVWGDQHRPDERPFLRSCPIAPQPRGTYQSTGGFVNFFDCRADIIGTWNVAMAALDDPQGWSFSDTEDARTGTLGQVQTFGSDDSSRSAVTIWDCGSDATVDDDTTGVFVAGLSPGLGDTEDATVPGTWNHTLEGTSAADLLFVLTQEDPDGDCDHSDDFGHDFYGGVCAVYCVGEGDFNPIDPNNKRAANFNMGFTTGSRGGFPFSLGSTVGGSGDAGMHGDAGLGWGGSVWSSGTFWASKPGFGTVRTDLSDPQRPEAGVAHAYWQSFYASVGKATTDRQFLLPGGEGEYGSWHCDGAESGIHQGWNCDPATWYVNPDGTPEEPTTPAELDNHDLARPGQKYQLLDVDCTDGGIGTTGIGIQPAFYGDAPCPV